MKNSILFLLLLISSIAFGQSVPNTETFSLQDVIDVVNPSSNDLMQCFSEADSSYFDPTYDNDTYAPASSLLRFRNYTIPTSTTTYYLTTTTADIGSGNNFSNYMSVNHVGLTQLASIAPFTLETDYFYTVTNVPNSTQFPSGAYIVNLYFLTADSNVKLAIRLLRVNSSGVLQEYSATSPFQYITNTNTNYQYTFNSVTWGSGSSTDRFGIELIWSNEGSSTANIYIDINTTNPSSVITPF